MLKLSMELMRRDEKLKNNQEIGPSGEAICQLLFPNFYNYIKLRWWSQKIKKKNTTRNIELRLKNQYKNCTVQKTATIIHHFKI